jgi:hypothetical protein
MVNPVLEIPEQPRPAVSLAGGGRRCGNGHDTQRNNQQYSGGKPFPPHPATSQVRDRGDGVERVFLHH